MSKNFLRIGKEFKNILGRRLSESEKEQITHKFSSGKDIQELAKNFNCTKSTIIRNLKKSLGQEEYENLIDQFKLIKDVKNLNAKNNKREIIENSETNSSFKNSGKQKSFNKESFATDSPSIESFIEIAPLNYEIDNESQKDLSSVPLSEINLPDIVYMIIHKNVELETKTLKDYSIWQFLPESDLNRKTIEIYYDLSTAKKVCNKEQKVIKVPNTDVFRIASPILLSRGISRIICSDQLIAI